ncbi:hypothetical protein [Pseudonocardia sp. MH-G8]|nr:hypothetical protein [Pseudonocardia sp. MH-G8]
MRSQQMPSQGGVFDPPTVVTRAANDLNDSMIGDDARVSLSG